MGNTIDPGLYLANRKASEKQTGQNTLGKDDFLKLLITQLQNQDPMQPMQDKEFISQMATFTSLEQMTNMNKLLENVLSNQLDNSLMSYSEMIGKEVEWNKYNDELEKDELMVGQVKSVLQKDGVIQLQLQTGELIMPSQITRVSKPSALE